MKVTYPGPSAAVRVLATGQIVKAGESIDVDADLGKQLVAQGWGAAQPAARKTPAKKSAARKTPAKKSAARKTAAKKADAPSTSTTTSEED